METCWLRGSLRSVLFIGRDFWNECKYKEGSCDPWDPEAEVWIAKGKDIPGLVLENEYFDALVIKVQHAVPELLELNHLKPDSLIQFCPASFTRDCYPDRD